MSRKFCHCHELKAQSQKETNAIKLSLLLCSWFIILIIVAARQPSIICSRFQGVNTPVVSPDLSSLEQLQKKIIDDQSELLWDSQHINEMEEMLETITRKFENRVQKMKNDEHELKEEVHELGESLAAAREMYTQAKEDDFSKLMKFSDALKKVNVQLHEQRKENELLKAQLQQLKESPSSKNLRGNPDVAAI